MAALMRHGLWKGGQEINTCKTLFMILTRNKGTVFKPSYKMPYNRKKKLPQKTQLDSTGESISAKGFHRPQKHYLPPVDVSEKIESVYKSVTGASNLSGKSLDDSSVKFQILNECSKEFQHSVPNSLLSTIYTMEDVVEFYKTPVHKIAPLDAMKNMDLPENLHIQTEYHRFHPETDTLFKGISAFPRSSTIVTSIRYKKKYKGFKAESPWLDI
ncbi:uncharacterized protein mRpL50 [Periplaneta americana]|uniref:uncharacterized protein mRpL50 n=1 Tax=Periplaneta americana TaxID=6978 RepID=UPI0037E78BD1